MRCSYCSSELPKGALFCGECGRAVQTAPPPPRPLQSRPLTVPAPPPDPSRSVPTGPALVLCATCAAPLDVADSVCGSCGAPVGDPSGSDAVSPSGGELESAGSPADSSDTALVEPVEMRSAASLPASLAATHTTKRAPRDRFVLQFSTGESHTVVGTGLVGRNPKPEPGESFDHLVVVLDPTRSVSKTHLEFGQDSGAFWVCDRFSGNGTVLREPESAPQRLHPDRRYRVPRGTRVDMGDQFFVVS